LSELFPEARVREVDDSVVTCLVNMGFDGAVVREAVHENRFDRVSCKDVRMSLADRVFVQSLWRVPMSMIGVIGKAPAIT
jgi:uncharacterized UBP type Zn finger protein